MKEQRMRRTVLLGTVGLIGVLVTHPGIAASPEAAAHAGQSRTDIGDRLSNELSTTKFVQDNSGTEEVSTSPDTELGVYLDLHQWAAGSPLGSPPFPWRDGAARSN